MRSRTFKQTMLRLAMIVALLMALMPSLMRLGGHADFGHAGMMVLRGMSGMQSMHAYAGTMADAGHAMPSHRSEDSNDCAYCPMLAILAALALVLLILPARRVPAWFHRRTRTAACIRVRMFVLWLYPQPRLGQSGAECVVGVPYRPA